MTRTRRSGGDQRIGGVRAGPGEGDDVAGEQQYQCCRDGEQVSGAAVASHGPHAR
ncbi:hypothetical protein ACFQZ4_05535 [Catellatospora coxensis]